MESCLFCKIVAGQIPARIVWQDENALAFPDIRPQTPVHVLVIPKRHFEAFGELADSPEVLASMAKAVREVAKTEGVDETGYRLLSNTGPDAGQEVPHVHVHLFGGHDLGPMLARAARKR